MVVRLPRRETTFAFPRLLILRLFFAVSVFCLFPRFSVCAYFRGFVAAHREAAYPEGKRSSWFAASLFLSVLPLGSFGVLVAGIQPGGCPSAPQLSGASGGHPIGLWKGA